MRITFIRSVNCKLVIGSFSLSESNFLTEPCIFLRKLSVTRKVPKKIGSKIRFCPHPAELEIDLDFMDFVGSLLNRNLFAKQAPVNCSKSEQLYCWVALSRHTKINSKPFNKRSQEFQMLSKVNK